MARSFYPTEYTQWLADTLLYVHQDARKQLGDKLRAQKHYYDRRLKARVLEVGDKVLWLRRRVKKHLASKQTRREELLHYQPRR